MEMRILKEGWRVFREMPGHRGTPASCGSQGAPRGLEGGGFISGIKILNGADLGNKRKCDVSRLSLLSPGAPYVDLLLAAGRPRALC